MVSVSFEFFPPKTEEMERALWSTLERLAPYEPAFVSVTYGAGGSTRERTHATVARIVEETGLSAAAHLTCVDATRAEIDAVARRYWDAGIRHVVALRGDSPAEDGKYTPHPDGYAYAVDLVAGLRAIAPFEVSVAAYPEIHPDAPDPDFDLDNLKRKIDAGADRAITQFFFENADFLRFRDRVAAAGIDVPLVPGIMPVSNFKSIVRFADMCGAAIPGWLAEAFDGLDDAPEARARVAERIAVRQCRELAEHGVDTFHIYTLNRAALSAAICECLGMAPAAAPEPARRVEAQR